MPFDKRKHPPRYVKAYERTVCVANDRRDSYLIGISDCYQS
jgi:hypothetical protein